MKKNITLLAISLILMILAPLLVTKLTPANLEMPVVMSMFFIVYPLYSIILGYICGKDVKKTFFQPILLVGLFLLGILLLFTIQEKLFFVIAFAYLLLSIIFMVISASRPKKEKKVKTKKETKVEEPIIENN